MQCVTVDRAALIMHSRKRFTKLTSSQQVLRSFELGLIEQVEVGFRSMESPVDYFLFIEVDSNKMPSIIEKYGLEPRDFTTPGSRE